MSRARNLSDVGGISYITATGNKVGIGSTIPQYTLDVSGTVTATSFVGPLTGTASTATSATTAYGLTGTPNITVGSITSGNINSSGVVTATSFVGNVTGTATGLSGTPNITVGNITGVAATFTGNVSIAGTLTYEDVTNVDSVGLVTARSGVQVTGGNLLVGTSSSTGTASQTLQVTGGGYVSGNLGVGITNPTAGFSCLTYGTDLFSASQVYYSPSGRAHMLFGEASSGADLWIGFKGAYGATSGSVNILLQSNFQDTSQHAGGYISNEALSATTSATCFGFLTGGSTISTRTSKSEKLRITSSGDVGIGITNPSAVSGAGQGTSLKVQVQGSLYLYEGGNTGNHGAGIGFGVATFPSYTPMAQIKGLLGNAPAGGTELQGDLGFYTRLSSSAGQTLTERGRFTNLGYFKASNDGTYYGSAASIHEFRQTTTADNLYVTCTNASYASVSNVHNISRAASSAYFFLFAYSGGGGDLEFILRGDGNAFADGTWSGGGADYAEMFEWEDGNSNNEDRVGYTVSLINNKIQIAQEGDDVIGVVSGNPSVVGDSSWNKWTEKYLKDEFNRYIFEEHNVVEWTDEDGKEHSYEDWNLPNDVVVPADSVIKTHDEKGNRFTHRKLNPEYNPDLEYVAREDRQEWDAIGLVGKLRVRKGQVIGNRWIKMRDINENVEEWLVR